MIPLLVYGGLAIAALGFMLPDEKKTAAEEQAPAKPAAKPKPAESGGESGGEE